MSLPDRPELHQPCCPSVPVYLETMTPLQETATTLIGMVMGMLTLKLASGALCNSQACAHMHHGQLGLTEKTWGLGPHRVMLSASRRHKHLRYCLVNWNAPAQATLLALTSDEVVCMLEGSSVMQGRMP